MTTKGLNRSSSCAEQLGLDCGPATTQLDLSSSSCRGSTATLAVQTQQVFAAWQNATGRQGTKLDQKRATKIRLALGMYPLADVLDAVCGWQNDPFYCGQNDRNRPYNELTLLLRDAEHIERFRDMARAPVVQRIGQRAARTQNGDLWSRLAQGAPA